MRIALLTDVHANLEALLACLEHADRAGAGLVARGGAAVMGNHDQATLQGPSPRMNTDARAVIGWTRSRLSPDALAFLAGLPLSLEESGRLYVHANAWAPEQWDYITSPFDAGRSMRATL